MKTPNKAARFDARNNDAAAKSVRRKRVLTAFDCESLEGRKLMTGFAGATGPMMGHGPAEMANIDGSSFAKGDWQGYDAGSDNSVGTDSTSAKPDLAGGTDAHSNIAQPNLDQSQNDSLPGNLDSKTGAPGASMKGNLNDGNGFSQAKGAIQAGATGSAQAGFVPMSSQTDSTSQDNDGSAPTLGKGDETGSDKGFAPMIGKANGSTSDQGGFVPMSTQGGGMDTNRGGFGTMSRQGGGLDTNRDGSAPTGDQSSSDDTQFQTDLTKLQTDEQAIHDKSQVTPALEAAVRKDNEAIDAAKTTAASTTALKTQQTDEQTIFSGSTAPTDAQQATLQTDRDAVLLSEGVSQTLIDQLNTDQAAIKTASNFTAADQATLDADHAALKADRDGTDSSSTTASTTSTTTAATTSTSTSTDSSTTTPATTASTTATTASTDPTATTTTSTAAVQGGAGATTHRFGMQGGDRSFGNRDGGSDASDRTAGDDFRGDDSAASDDSASGRSDQIGQNSEQATSFGAGGMRRNRG